jgi:hypothetical protein
MAPSSSLQGHLVKGCPSKNHSGSIADLPVLTQGADRLIRPCWALLPSPPELSSSFRTVCLSHASSTFCSGYFGDGGSLDHDAPNLFFFFVVLRLELRAYTLSHSTNPLCVKGFFEIGSPELFARAGFEP